LREVRLACHCRASAFATASADERRRPGEALAQTGDPAIHPLRKTLFEA